MIFVSLSALNNVRMGLILGELEPEKYSELKHGVVVNKVIADSPAEKAGLEKDDILLEIDDDKIFTIDQIHKMLSFYQPGDEIKIDFLRDQKRKKCKLVLAESSLFHREKKAYIGIFLTELEEEDREDYQENFGLKITRISEDSPAEKAGLKKGDFLMKFQNEKLYTAEQLQKMLENYEPEEKVTLNIFRNGKEKEIELTLGKTEKINDFFFDSEEFPFSLDFMPGNVLFYKYDINDDEKWIGVRLKIEEKQENKNGENKTTKTMTVKEVFADSPAEKAGFQVGDEILSINGKKDVILRDIIQEKEIGDTINMEISRNGEIINITTRIGEKVRGRNDVRLKLENGEVKVMIDGLEKHWQDLDTMKDDLDDIRIIKEFKLDEINNMKNSLQEIKEELKDVDIEIEIFEDKKEEF